MPQNLLQSYIIFRFCLQSDACTVIPWWIGIERSGLRSIPEALNQKSKQHSKLAKGNKKSKSFKIPSTNNNASSDYTNLNQLARGAVNQEIRNHTTQIALEHFQLQNLN